MRVLKIRQPKTFNKIIQLMSDGEVYSFHDILDFLNSNMKHGCTHTRLGNILSKYPDFEKVDFIMGGSNANEYKVSTWRYVAWE